jgi:hypothetical protein
MEPDDHPTTPNRPCPFPDPASLDPDALASVAATLASFVDDSRRVYENDPNPVTKWLMQRDELASDYVSQLVEFRFGQALDEGELDEGDDGV